MQIVQHEYHNWIWISCLCLSNLKQCSEKRGKKYNEDIMVLFLIRKIKLILAYHIAMAWTECGASHTTYYVIYKTNWQKCHLFGLPHQYEYNQSHFWGRLKYKTSSRVHLLWNQFLFIKEVSRRTYKIHNVWLS